MLFPRSFSYEGKKRRLSRSVIKYRSSGKIVTVLQNFSDSNVQPIEQRMLDQRPRESGILSTRTRSSSQTVNVNNTSIRNVESPAVAAQLRNLFPTVGKRSVGGKSSNSKCVKGKKPPAKNTKEKCSA